MNIRRATSGDILDIITLFRRAVLETTVRDYNRHQRNAWVNRGGSTVRWEKRIGTQYFLLAEQSAQCLGFGSIAKTGYLDVLYVHPAHLGKGIATQLLGALETWAKERNIHKITTDASLTARPFFVKNAYIVKKEQQNWLGNVMLINYCMEKTL